MTTGDLPLCAQMVVGGIPRGRKKFLPQICHSADMSGQGWEQWKPDIIAHVTSSFTPSRYSSGTPAAQPDRSISLATTSVSVINKGGGWRGMEGLRSIGGSLDL